MQLTAHDLSIGYRNHLVGSNIALTLAPGEVLCLLGPNGAGKTTLFRTLLGLQRALGGAVLLDERADRPHAPGRDRAPHGLCAAGARDRVLLHGARRRADGPHRAAQTVRESRRRGREDRARKARRARHRGPRRARLHPHLRRPAPAHADRARARAGSADPGDGRADREPRLRQPGDGARPHPRSRGAKATASCSRPTIRTTRCWSRRASP